jgi:uncharacterized protein involved in type VI secretion and phage assembly
MEWFDQRGQRPESRHGTNIAKDNTKTQRNYRLLYTIYKDCQSLATGRWFSPGPPVSSTNKTDRHDIAEILLKVALNTIKQINKPKTLFGPVNFSVFI